MAIANVNLTDTFDVWRTRTNQIVYILNTTDSNVVRVASGSANSLSVSPGTIGRGGSFTITITPSTDPNDTSTGNVVASSVANANRQAAISGFTQANAAYGQANAAYGQANAAFNQANAAIGAITTANTNITSAFNAANSASPIAAFNQANAAIGAITTANTNITSAFNQANNVGGAVTTANVIAIAAFAKANGALANTSNITFGGTLNVSSDLYTFRSLGVGTMPSGVTGEIRAANNVTAYYSSDINLKTNITSITNSLEKVKSIRGVEFDWIDDYIVQQGGEDGYYVRKHDVGVIAQELESVLPEVVATRGDGMKAVKYDRIVALLIEAIKELEEKVARLETK